MSLPDGLSRSPSDPPCPEPPVATLEHVLVCLDRSAQSDDCLPYARFIAEASGARITLLHVIPSPPGASEPNRADALEWEIAKREVNQYLVQARASLGNALQETVIRQVQGAPAEQIVTAARELRADLTILSSHGEGGRSRADMGSVAQRVLTLAGGSVLLAPPASSASVPPRRILVPLDGSLRAESILPLVALLARLHGSEVLLVHVVTEPTSTAVLSSAEDMGLAQSLASRQQVNAETYLAAVRARLLPRVGVVKTFVARRAEDRQALLDVGTEQSADMLVLTAHGSTCNVDRAFGSFASYLLTHAQQPIFVSQDMPSLQRALTPGQTARGALSARPLESNG